MSFNNNIKTHKIQFALTDSNKERNEESNTIPTKTYQSNSFRSVYLYPCAAATFLFVNLPL